MEKQKFMRVQVSYVGRLLFFGLIFVKSRQGVVTQTIRPPSIIMGWVVKLWVQDLVVRV